MRSRHSLPGSRFYKVYRKIRYLSYKGSLFSFVKTKQAGQNFQPGTFSTIAINSTFLFLIAYLAINILNLLITGYAALAYEIPVIVYYHDVDFLIRGIDWTSDSVTGVFSSGMVSMLIITLLLLILYKSVETETGLLRLLLLWFVFHGFTRVLGEITIGAVMGKGFGFVMTYLFIMDTGKVVVTLLGTVVMITVGLSLTKISLFTANSYLNNLMGSYCRKFAVNQFFLPFLFGNLVILVIKLPEINYFDIFINASMILMLAPIVIRSGGMKDFYFDQDPKKISINPWIILAALLMLLLFRVIFGIGLRL